jgi:parvulin-like peptidyl-prolyl isomerase
MLFARSADFTMAARNSITLAIGLLAVLLAGSANAFAPASLPVLRVRAIGSSSPSSGLGARAVCTRPRVMPRMDAGSFAPFMLPYIGPYLHNQLGTAGDVINFVLPLVLVSQLPKLANIGKKSARASHVLVPKADEAKLEQLKAQIDAGERAFDDVAREYSTCPSSNRGGDLGEFRQGMMVPEFDRAVFAEGLQLGSVLGPIRTQFGWHLIKVDSRSDM